MTRPSSAPTSDGPILIDRRFPIDPQAASLARHALDAFANEVAVEDLETIRLLTSELMTNAIRHGPQHPGSDIGLLVEQLDGRMRVEVSDAGAGFAPPGRGGREVGGWGLMLVEQLSDRWGVAEGAPTRVWFELAAGLRPQGDVGAPTIDALLLDAQHAAVIATDPEGIVVRWNRHAERLYGYTKQEALGRRVTDLTVRPGDQHAA